MLLWCKYYRFDNNIKTRKQYNKQRFPYAHTIMVSLFHAVHTFPYQLLLSAEVQHVLSSEHFHDLQRPVEVSESFVYYNKETTKKASRK